ncbi:MAG TPA: hypothetical protein VEO20_08375 [Thermoplasmata archaeon]|nr:hypothetical protein [Thermoplasmata archaeon]
MVATNPERIECFFDGSCQGNQFREKGPMRAAYMIGDREVVRDVPDMRTREGLLRSNNIAEYHGLIFLLRELSEMDRRRGRKAAYTIYGDSQLVIRQVKGTYRVRAQHLIALRTEAHRLAAEIDVTLREVPRGRNKAGFLLE